MNSITIKDTEDSQKWKEGDILYYDHPDPYDNPLYPSPQFMGNTDRRIWEEKYIVDKVIFDGNRYSYDFNFHNEGKYWHGTPAFKNMASRGVYSKYFKYFFKEEERQKRKEEKQRRLLGDAAENRRKKEEKIKKKIKKKEKKLKPPETEEWKHKMEELIKIKEDIKDLPEGTYDVNFPGIVSDKSKEKQLEWIDYQIERYQKSIVNAKGGIEYEKKKELFEKEQSKKRQSARKLDPMFEKNPEKLFPGNRERRGGRTKRRRFKNKKRTHKKRKRKKTRRKRKRRRKNTKKKR